MAYLRLPRKDDGVPASPTVTVGPMVTLYDGRVVPAITLENGSFLVPTTKSNGELETAVSEYTASRTTLSTSTFKSPSSVPTGAYSTTLPSGSTVTTDSASPSFTFVPPFPQGSSDDNPHFWSEFSQGAKAGIVIAIIMGFVAIVIASIWFCCGKPRRHHKASKERESMMLEVERVRALQRTTAPGASVEQLGVPLRTMSTASRERVMREGRAREVQDVPTPIPMNGHRTSVMSHSTHGSLGRVASRLGRHMSLRGGGGIDAPPPPAYEEVVPHAHQSLAGGMRQPQNYNHNVRQEEVDDGMGVISDGKTPLSEIPFEDVVLESSRSEASSSRNFGARHGMGGGDTRGHTNS